MFYELYVIFVLVLDYHMNKNVGVSLTFVVGVV